MGGESNMRGGRGAKGSCVPEANSASSAKDPTIGGALQVRSD